MILQPSPLDSLAQAPPSQPAFPPTFDKCKLDYKSEQLGSKHIPHISTLLLLLEQFAMLLLGLVRL